MEHLPMSEPEPEAEARVRRTITIKNQRDTKLVVVLEPWANEYELQPNECVDVVEEGVDSDEPLEIYVEASYLVVYARRESMLSAFRDGVELQ
jgi:hypothetical protein